jgi:hypothetical protein
MYVGIWGEFPTEYSFNVIFSWCMLELGGLLTKYSFHVCRGQVNVQLNFHSVYAGIRWIIDQIVICYMQGSDRLPTEYSFHVCWGQADVWPNIHSIVYKDQADYRSNIHLFTMFTIWYPPSSLKDLGQWLRHASMDEKYHYHSGMLAGLALHNLKTGPPVVW